MLANVDELEVGMVAQLRLDLRILKLIVKSGKILNNLILVVKYLNNLLTAYGFLNISVYFS